MRRTPYVPQHRYHAPLSEKMYDELLLSIRRGNWDAAECRVELIHQGWTDAQINEAVRSATPATSVVIEVGDIVTIRGGARQYDVTQVDTLDGDLARIWPRDPHDTRPGQWVSTALLTAIVRADARVVDGERFPLIRHASSACYTAFKAKASDHQPCTGSMVAIYPGDPTTCLCPCHDSTR